MSGKRSALILALLGALAAGCSGDRDEILVSLTTDAFPEQRRLVVYANGRAELEWSTAIEPVRGRGSFRIPPDGLERLRETLAEADFPALEPEYLPGAQTTDGAVYRLTHGGREIVVGDWAGGDATRVPLSLRRVVGSLNRLARPELERIVERALSERR
jgi:hypothetical protein